MWPYELYVFDFVQTNWRKTLRIRGRLPSVPFDRKLDTRSSILVHSGVVVLGTPTTDATAEPGTCPWTFLCLSLLFPCPFRKKGKLVRSLVPIAHLLEDRDCRSMYQREEQLRQIRLLRK